MAGNCEGAILLQNYPLYSMSTTSRRYERDRGQTTRANQQNKRLVTRKSTATNRIDTTHATCDNLIVTSTKMSQCCHNSAPDKRQLSAASGPINRGVTHLATLSPMPSIKLTSSNFVSQLHGAFNSLPNTKQPLLTSNSNNSSNSINKSAKQRNNVKRLLTVLTIAFISLSNVHNNGARMILCDKVSSYSNDKQTISTGPLWNEAQAVASSTFKSPTIKQQPIQPYDTNLKRMGIGYPTNKDDNNNDETSLNGRTSTIGAIGSGQQSAQQQHHHQKASLTNQLLLLLAHPFINNDNKQQIYYHHQQQQQHNRNDNDDKLLQDRNSIVANNQRNNDNNGVHSFNSHFLPVTTSPVTATLMAPNLFTPVTPPTFAQTATSAITPDHTKLPPPPNSQTNRMFQTDAADIEAANLFANNQANLEQSDLAMAMSELSPSLVLSDQKDQAFDTDLASNLVNSAMYEKQLHQHNMALPLPTLLQPTFLDGHQFTSGAIHDSNSWPPMMVADRNSVGSASNTAEHFGHSLLANAAAAAATDNQQQQGSSRVARKLRSLHDKSVQSSKHAGLTPNKNSAKPRGIMWEMATDTSLGVTLLHMMDRASFALPLGFFLMPIIQMMKSPSGGAGGAASGALSLARFLPARASHRSVDYEDLVKRIDYVDKLLSKALRPSHRSAVVGRKR